MDTNMDVDDAKDQEIVEDAGVEYTDLDNLKPIEEGTDMDEFVANLLQELKSADWKAQFNAFNELRRFYKFGPFEAYLPKYQEDIIDGVENLRSSICRNSLILVKEVFTETKDLYKVDDNGERTPYADFCKQLLPVVASKIADDKVFLASLAKT
jgi:hypothetical protein